MNSTISKFLFYYPATIAKAELVGMYLRGYRKRQFWSNQQLREWQAVRGSKLLHYAKNNYSFYEKRLKGLQIDPNSFWEQFREVPFLTKQDLIESGQEFRGRRNLFSSIKTTGGSTGEPVTILKSANALARERAATWRSYEWAGVSIGDPQARFWGVPHNEKESLKAKVIDFISNRKRFSAFDLTEDSLLKYFSELKRFQPSYLYGYVSVIEAFAKFVSMNELGRIVSLRSVITTSEVLTESARKTIQEAFGVPVFNEYGCGEVGSIAHECSDGSMHIVSDNLIVEIDGGDEGQRSGEIVVTDLFNFAQPLIRYRLGDFATSNGETCSCGVKLPSLQGVHGRAYDMLEAPSGRKVHPEAVMYLFEELQTTTQAFRQFQVIQTALDQFEVKVIPTKVWSDRIGNDLRRLIQKNFYEQCKVEIKVVDSLFREKSGKLRVVKNNIKMP